MHAPRRLKAPPRTCAAIVVLAAASFLGISLGAARCPAQTATPHARAPRGAAYEKAVQPFRKNYLNLEFARNYPLSFAQNHFDPGPLHPMLGYRYNVDGSWLMGVGAQFKSFRRRQEQDPRVPDQSRELVLWSVYHEMYYAMRLEHPFYFLMGPRLLYMLPSKAGKLPLLRDDTQTHEVGAALSMMLVRVFAGGSLLTLRVDRWRGTTTQKLHGLETSLGWSFPLADP